MHGIIGSGFGLYGYLPAMLLHQPGPVLLAERSRPRLVGRPELAWTLPRIAWARDSRELLERASVLAIAIPPVAQQTLLEESPGLCARALLLEKPIACTPTEARRAFAMARAQGRKVRIGYTFPHTRWFTAVMASQTLRRADAVRVEWHFMAHHFATGLGTWKRQHDEGGGVLRFYGIQVLALLARMGFDRIDSTVLDSRDGAPDRMTGQASGDNVPPLQFSIDSRSGASGFRILAIHHGETVPVLDLRDPFAEEQVGRGLDARIPALCGVLSGLEEDDSLHDAASLRTIDLWEQAESLAACGIPT